MAGAVFASELDGRADQEYREAGTVYPASPQCFRHSFSGFSEGFASGKAHKAKGNAEVRFLCRIN